MTCEPIEIICDQCGRLRATVLLAVPVKDLHEVEAFILAMHREAQHNDRS